MGCCCDRRAVFGGSGLLFIIIASVMYPLIDIVTVSELEKNNVMKNGTILYENLRNPSPLVLYEFYFWNLENGAEYVAGTDEKLSFTQKGPYTYVEKYGRDQIEQNNGDYENSTYYSFRQTRLFTWSQEHSCEDCKKDDKPVTANIVANAIHGIVTDISRKRDWKNNEIIIECDKGTSGPNADCNFAPSKQNCIGLQAQKECHEDNLENWLMILAEDVFVNAGSKLYDDEKTVDQILFGFEDDIFKQLGQNLADRAADQTPVSPIKPILEELSDIFINLTYGLFQPKNGTVEEPGSGWDHFKNRNGNGQTCLDGRTTCAYRVNEILEWEGKTDLAPWYGEDKVNYCNRIEGTDGQSIYTDTRKEDTLNFFISDLCRTVFMVPAKVTVNLEGDGYKIPSEVWFGPPDVFYTKSRPENRCYCSPNLPEGWCEKYDGLHMMDQCQMGAPAVATGPHFSGGSMRWREDIEGMNPHETPFFEWGNAEHTSFNGYDLNSGAITFNSKKIQINFLVKKDKRISILDEVKNEDAVVWPIFWSNETMKLDDDTARSLYEASVKPMKIGTSLQYTMFALGGFLILIGIVEHFRTQRKQVDVPEKSEESVVEDPFKHEDNKSEAL